MYTDPAFSRQGVGRLILAECERAAVAEGFSAAELMATLSGEPLYMACGYERMETIETVMDGVKIPLVRIEKTCRQTREPAVERPRPDKATAAPDSTDGRGAAHICLGNGVDQVTHRAGALIREGDVLFGGPAYRVSLPQFGTEADEAERALFTKAAPRSVSSTTASPCVVASPCSTRTKLSPVASSQAERRGHEVRRASIAWA